MIQHRPFDINAFRLPVQQSIEHYQAEQTRKRELFAADSATEKTASALVRNLLNAKGWD